MCLGRFSRILAGNTCSALPSITTPLLGRRATHLRQDLILQSNPYKSNFKTVPANDHHISPDCMGNNDAKQNLELISETSSPNYHATRTPFLTIQPPKIKDPIDATTAYQCPQNPTPKHPPLPQLPMQEMHRHVSHTSTSIPQPPVNVSRSIRSTTAAPGCTAALACVPEPRRLAADEAEIAPLSNLS